MTRSEYYSAMKLLAQEKRKHYGLTTDNIKIPVFQRIYKQEGIKIDRRKEISPKIRAAYFCDSGCSVLLNNKLPREQKLFSLAHELKHHFVDQELIQNCEIQCGDYNANEVLEIGAEVFAAELIFPESEMRELIKSLGIDRNNCVKKSVIDIKRATSAPISYRFVVKRLERFNLISKDAFEGTQFKKLEEQIYGLPIYKQPGFQERRRRKKVLHNILYKKST